MFFCFFSSAPCLVVLCVLCVSLGLCSRPATVRAVSDGPLTPALSPCGEAARGEGAGTLGEFVAGMDYPLPPTRTITLPRFLPA